MPARNVIRPTLANRFSNTPASNPATINAAQLNQGSPNATAQTGTSPVAATHSTPQGFQGTGNVATVQMPQSEDISFITPSGAKGIIQLSSNGKAKITSNPQYTEPIKQNGKVIGTGTFDTTIVNGKLASQIIGFKGNTLTEPVNTTTNTSIGILTEKGTINYQYSLQGSELVPEITSTTGGIFYQSPRSAQQYSEASAANAAAKGNISEFHSFENIIIPSLTQQINTAFLQGHISYGIALLSELQSYTMFANQLLDNSIYSKGEFSGYDASGLLSASQTVMNNNKPVEVAKLTTTGLTPLATTVSDALYGTVNGKNQNLGTLSFTPTVTNGTFSLSYAGFKPSIVQIGGQGWNAGIYSSYNPATGQLSLNPKNYAYVSGNLLTQNGPNGEVIKTITMPSGFGTSQEFGAGTLNYLNITNIPVTSGKYSGLESYTSFGANGKYSLSYAGSFPLIDATTISLGKGITETEKATRQFNPLTGAITYSNSNTFAIPGLGSISLPSTEDLSETYNYKGNPYTFSFSPANFKYSITSQAIPQPTQYTNTTPSSLSQSIEFLFGNGGVTGYNILNAHGSVISSADYLTPKFVAGSNVSQPTLTGNTLIIPSSEYASYISNQNSNSIITSENKGVYNLLGNNAVSSFITGKWDPFYQIYQAGTLYGKGYTQASISEALPAIETGVAYASVVAGGYTLLAGGGLAALGATSASVLGTRAATGAAISIGLGEASSYAITGKPMTANQAVISGILGASTGVAFGGIGITGEQTLPQAIGATVYNVGKYAVAPMAVFSGGTAFAVGLLDPSVWSASGLGSNSRNTTGTGKSQRSQSGISKGATSTSSNINMAGEYLSYVGKSALSGAEFGAEFGGAMGGIGTLAGAAVKAISPSTFDFIKANPLIGKLAMSGTNMAITGTTGVALHEPIRVLVPAIAVAGAFPFTMGYLFSEPQLKDEAEPSTVVAIRAGPDAGGSGTIVTGNDEGNGLMRTNKYGSLEYRVAVKTPYANGEIVDVGTGAIRTLTGEATKTAPEVSNIFSGEMKVDRTVTVNPTRVQRFFGIGPKVMTSSFFTPTPDVVSTLLSDNPTIVVSQPGGIETTPELSDVYKTASVRPEGPTTLFHQSIATPQGQEWLGETGNTEGFKFLGKTSKFVMVEVGTNEALPSTEDLFAGRPLEMKASPYEGPKSTSEMKPFDLGDIGDIVKTTSPVSSEPTVETGKGEVQVQTTKTIPKTAQAGAASSISSARMPAYVNTESDVMDVFPLAQHPSRVSSSAIFQPKSIFKTPTITPTQNQISVSGIDPYALASQITSNQLINGSANTQKQASITNINRQSNLNPLSNMLYSATRSNLLFGSRVGLSNKTSYSLSNKTSVIQQQTQKQSQKQTQKQSQKNAYRNPPPTITPPPIPNYLYGAFAPDQRIKPPKPKAQKSAPPQKGMFKYINDLTSVMFNIHGSKKNKVYGSLGFFRPLS